MTAPPLAVAILTLNEERNLPRCLAGIPRDAAVYVVDSGSTDATIEIAERAGCEVIRRQWTGFADQRNFTIDHLKASFDWVLFIDADEIFPDPIWNWIGENLHDLSSTDVVYFSQRMFIDGNRLEHAPGYPVYHPRLIRCHPGLFVSNGTGHGESVKADLRVLYIDIPYDHYIIDGDASEWMHKHIGLAIKEMRSEIQDDGYIITNRARVNRLVPIGMGRTFARFLYHYVIKSGWRDKRSGLNYALLYTWYEMTKYILHRLHRDSAPP